MSQFPIYDSLCSEMTMTQEQQQHLLEEQENYLQEHVKDLDITGREIFYALIRKDECMNGRTSPSESSCKQMKHGVRIDYDKLLPRTKLLLYMFLKRHEQKLAEDMVV